MRQYRAEVAAVVDAARRTAPDTAGWQELSVAGPTKPDLVLELMERAYVIRGHVLTMAALVGEGYVGQGLDIADLLAVLYFSELRYRPKDVHWPDRDRFVLSVGHYAIGLYAALVAAGVIHEDLLLTYGGDGSLLDFAGNEKVPGLEITGGSLGQGLSQAVGMALGLRLDGRDARVYCLISDGELQEGAVWEAAMSASHYRLDNLVTFVDSNGQQADGPPLTVMGLEPIEAKWSAFGWHTQRVNGNDVGAILSSLTAIRSSPGAPHMIVLDTILAKGIPMLEQRDRNHFIRVHAEEWEEARSQLDRTWRSG